MKTKRQRCDRARMATAYSSKLTTCELDKRSHKAGKLGEAEISGLRDFFELLGQIERFLHSLGYEVEGNALCGVQQDLKERVFLASDAQFGEPKAVH